MTELRPHLVTSLCTGRAWGKCCILERKPLEGLGNTSTSSSRDDSMSIICDEGHRVPGAMRSIEYVDIVASAPLYQLVGRGMKRQRELKEAGGESEGQQDEGALDADMTMQAAENAYHVDLVDMLRQPRMYHVHALGLSGPPHGIRHASLEERMNTMQLAH